jgi:hypothetical protein
MDSIRMNSPITEAYKSMLKAGKPAFSNAQAKDKKGGSNTSVKQVSKAKKAVMGKPKAFTKPKMKVMKENEEKRDVTEVLEELNAVSTLGQMIAKVVEYGYTQEEAVAKICKAIYDLEQFQPILEKVVAEIEEPIELEELEDLEASTEELEKETEELEDEEKELEAEEEAEEDKE